MPDCARISSSVPCVMSRLLLQEDDAVARLLDLGQAVANTSAVAPWLGSRSLPMIAVDLVEPSGPGRWSVMPTISSTSHDGEQADVGACRARNADQGRRIARPAHAVDDADAGVVQRHAGRRDADLEVLHAARL